MAIARGIAKTHPHLDTQLLPLADGGEGTAEILTYHSKGRWMRVEVSDPLGRPHLAGFGLSADGKTAFLDMAQAAGLPLLTPEERNPLRTTTYGVGELILAAVGQGAHHIILGIGGSATNDAGMGMAAALGFRFFDVAGHLLDPIGGNLEKVVLIDESNVSPLLKPLQVSVLCDVNNPLYGPNGAAHVYAPQKGADVETVNKLDQGLAHFAKAVAQWSGTDFSDIPGAGAAGGLGFGAMAFLDAQLRPGTDTILDQIGFERHLQKADVLITGEGKLDRQTLQGKLIGGVTRLAGKYKVPVMALCGQLAIAGEELKSLGIREAHAIMPPGMSLEESMARTSELLETKAAELQW